MEPLSASTCRWACASSNSLPAARSVLLAGANSKSRHEQVPFETKDCLLFRAAVPKGGSGSLPVSSGLGHVVELHNRDGQAVHDTLLVLGDIEHLHDGSADQVD